jgi:hypothetical protein
MGFSVHQPEIGAPLQFFPAMGSKELDDLIDAYVPGQATIMEKRAAVSLEFFDHSIQSGELFEFFLVYPSLPSATTSPASLQDSGYASSLNTSPVMSESQWTIGSTASAHKARPAKKAASGASRFQAADFSHIPGMKIMTRDGTDVTNSASRGCKTKEQRDHAHLMRIIKACDACKRKKTRCDPSHKKRGSSASSSLEPKVSKRTKMSAAPTPIKAAAASPASFDIDLSFDYTIPESFSFDDSFATVAETTTVNEWDQFITYDEEVTDTIPYDYDFFFDPAGYFSPAATNSSSSSSSSQILTPSQSQPITPAGIVDEVGIGRVEYANSGLGRLGEDQQPTLPYLHPAGVEIGNNYVDFALYSPGSTCLDDDPALSSEVAASRGPDYSEYQQVSDSRVPASRASERREGTCVAQSEQSRENLGSGRLHSVAAEISSPVLVGSGRPFSQETMSLFDTGDHDRVDTRDQSSDHDLGLSRSSNSSLGSRSSSTSRSRSRSSLNGSSRGVTASSLAFPAQSPESRVPGVTGPPFGGSSPLPPAYALPSASAMISSTAKAAGSIVPAYTSAVEVRSSPLRIHCSLLIVLKLLHSVEGIKLAESSVASSAHTNTLGLGVPVVQQSSTSDVPYVQESLAANTDSGHEQRSTSFRHQRRLRVSGEDHHLSRFRANAATVAYNGLETYQVIGNSSSVFSRAMVSQASSARVEASGLLLATAASAATAATAAIGARALPITAGDAAMIALNLVPVAVLFRSQIRSQTSENSRHSSSHSQSKTQHHHQSETLWWTTSLVVLAGLVATATYLVIGTQALLGVAAVALSFLAPSSKGQKHSISGMKLLEAIGPKGIINNVKSRVCGMLSRVSGRRNVLNGERAALVHFIQ